MSPLESLAKAINEEWKRIYGEECGDVSDVDLLAMRIRKIGDDRDCWVFNAKANQREYQRLEKLAVNNSQNRER